MMGTMVYNNPDVARRGKNKKTENGGLVGQASFKAALAAKDSHIREPLPVYDVREAQGKFDIDIHGFIFTNIQTAMAQTAENIFDPEEREIRKTSARTPL